MKISVIIPFFNEAHTLKQTLLSLARQTLRPNEIILVDSGSTDDSVSIINEFVKDNRIDYIHIIQHLRLHHLCFFENSFCYKDFIRL